MATLIARAKLNDIDPLDWLADVLARMPALRRACFSNCCPRSGRGWAAHILGRDEDLLWDLSDQLEPEDGKIWIHDIDDINTLPSPSSGLRRSERSLQIRSIASPDRGYRSKSHPRRGTYRMEPLASALPMQR